MLSLRGLAALACTLVGVAACNGDSGPNIEPTSACTAASVQNLAAGAFSIIDPATDGSCVGVPAAGGAGAEYLYAALATDGIETATGKSASYLLNGGAVSATLASGHSPNPMLAPFRGRLPSGSAAFHRRLRERERALSQAPGASFRRGQGPSRAMAAVVTPPTVGQERTFFVCGTADCDDNGFVQVTAKVKHVGQRVAIYVDNNAPVGGYTQNELDNVGALFDDYLYPIDTTAFGRESDIDSNGVVAVLLTPRVNALSNDCSISVILGYFFGLDLFPDEANSNGGEIFYGLVPDPASLTCMISTAYANNNLPPTFIHEFQHMISFNQHVLVRQAFSAEDVWLNEGLSHYAEELGGRNIPDIKCFNNDCLTQFAAGDLVNAYNYLMDLESQYLVAPGNSSGTLEERGAGWMFVRWLADQFGTDQSGTNVTRQLVGTSRVGATNVETVTGQSFSTLVPLWQLANYLDDLPGFTTTNPFLQYPSWDFRAVFAAFHGSKPADFPREFPLEPDPVTQASYSRAGMLRAGSGRHALITQAASGAPVQLRLTASDGVALPPATVKPRIAILRIR